jgi:hypothetical protein
MAIDTQSKRASAVAHGRIWLRGRVTPSGLIDAEERMAICCTYNGNALSGPVLSTVPTSFEHVGRIPWTR